LDVSDISDKHINDDLWRTIMTKKTTKSVEPVVDTSVTTKKPTTKKTSAKKPTAKKTSKK
jgi:hypothetical protein